MMMISVDVSLLGNSFNTQIHTQRKCKSILQSDKEIGLDVNLHKTN
jgi:hypothetical protein